MSKQTVTRLVAASVCALALAGLLVPVGGGAEARPRSQGSAMDLSAFSADPPSVPTPLLFIHHSCGGQMLADFGPTEKAWSNCILELHPNGGGLRGMLEKSGYVVHEASYGSEIGEKTDLFDWLPKFQTKMDKILSVERNDTLLADGKKNQIVVFKSCFPNSDFVGVGSPPGDPRGPELTLWNAKATLTAVLAELQKRPDVLFVYLTAPPEAPPPPERLWKYAIKRATGKATALEKYEAQAAIARQFNDWAKSPEGWLKGYAPKNVAVFDYFDVLTDGGTSNLSRYPSGDGRDSHPTAEGNAKAAAAFVPFLNRAVHRAASK